MEKMLINPPRAKKIPHLLTAHGHKRQDPYYWMKDRENPNVIAYLNEENAYLKAGLAHTDSLQETLFEEMKGRIKEEDQSAPYRLRDYYYYYRYRLGQEYPVYCRQRHLEAEEEVTLDVNLLAEGSSYCQVAGVVISPDQQRMVFGVDTVGRRIYELRFRDLQTGDYLAEVIQETTGNVVWAEDNETVLYSRQDPKTLRAYQIYRHRLGTDPAQDVLVYEETDDTYRTYVSRSKNREYLFIISDSTLRSEVRFLKADQPEATPQVLLAREGKHEYSVDHFEGYFYIHTNWEAQNFRLMRCRVDATAKEDWEEVIPHREAVLLEDFEIFRDYLVLQERENGLNQICVWNWALNDSFYLQYHDPAYTATTSYNPELDTLELRYSYESLTTPRSTYVLNMKTRETHLLKQQEVLGGFAVANYQSERIFARASDGTQVPISLVYHKDTPREGSAPLLLYGYGSYGYSLDPYFSSARLSLLDRGFIFAIAHIRGGEEMGRSWYESGKLLHKKNTFTDFIACGEHLIAQGYCHPQKLCISGGSAGGLLVGAVINMRPELFYGALAAVPFVDVITTMLDDTIPLTTGEYDEWGNPNDKAFYDYMLSYSPYDNVREQEYPHLLITSGLHDSQVQYWEPTKWVARLRERKTGSRQLYLYTNMDAGHSGASGRFQPFKEVALQYAFVLDLMR